MRGSLEIGLLLAMAIPTFGGVPAFGPPETVALPPGHFPTQPALADFDEDGRPDLLVPGRGPDGQVVLVLAVGAADSQTRNFPVGGGCDWVVARDMDADGHLDAVVAVRRIRGGVAVLRGLGDGTFEPPRFTWTGRECRCVDVADIDGDGKPDVVACNAMSGSIRVLRNLGGLTFEVGPPLGVNRWSVGVPNQSWVAWRSGPAGGELLDVAVGGSRLDVRPAWGEVGIERSWSAPSVRDSPVGVVFAELADLDGDGLPEWISQSLSLDRTNPLVVWKGRPDGEPGEARMFPGPANGRGWRAITSDLDRDGDLDVISLSVAGGELVVIENLSASGLLSLAPPQSLLEGYFLRHVLAADVSGDGLVDLIVCDATEDRVLILRQLPQGSPPPRAESRRAGRHAAQAVEPRLELSGLLAFGPPPEGTSADGLPQPRSAPATCGPGAGPCLEPHAGPGCFTTECCERVCEQVPWCCETDWDEVCVSWAEFSCDGIVCPSEGGCLQPHGGPGCEDETCCRRVQRLDPVCGSVWDELCVELATLSCGSPSATVHPPATAVQEAEGCGERLSEGCGNRSTPLHVPVRMGEAFAGRTSAAGVRDVDAHLLTLVAPTVLRVDWQADFPAHLVLASGPCAGPLQVIAEAVVPPGGSGRLERSLPTGEYRITIAMATASQTLRDGQPCPAGEGEEPVEPGHFAGAWWIALMDRTEATRCDLDASGLVDAGDIGALLTRFGGVDSQADLDRSGEVDAGDVGWLLTCFD